MTPFRLWCTRYVEDNIDTPWHKGSVGVHHQEMAQPELSRLHLLHTHPMALVSSELKWGQ